MNRFLDHVGSQYPIIQAPMGWIARSQLASAVCSAGGVGLESDSDRQNPVAITSETISQLHRGTFGAERRSDLRGGP